VSSLVFVRLPTFLCGDGAVRVARRRVGGGGNGDGHNDQKAIVFFPDAQGGQDVCRSPSIGSTGTSRARSTACIPAMRLSGGPAKPGLSDDVGCGSRRPGRASAIRADPRSRHVNAATWRNAAPTTPTETNYSPSPGHRDGEMASLSAICGPTVEKPGWKDRGGGRPRLHE